MTDDQWDAILDVHLKAPFRILRAAQPVISGLAKAEAAANGVATARKVVNISSIAGLGGNAGQANYSTAKAGIVGLTKTLAKEWGRYNVTVNAVAFGYIQTRLTATDGADHIDVAGNSIKVGMSEQLKAMTEQMIPLGRAGTPTGCRGRGVPALPARIRLRQRAGRSCAAAGSSSDGPHPVRTRRTTRTARRCARLHRARGRSAASAVGGRRHRRRASCTPGSGRSVRSGTASPPSTAASGSPRLPLQHDPHRGGRARLVSPTASSGPGLVIDIIAPYLVSMGTDRAEGSAGCPASCPATSCSASR